MLFGMNVRCSIMCIHTRLDKFHTRLPIALALLRELFRSRGHGDGLFQCASACGAQHEGTAKEADEVVLLWCETPDPLLVRVSVMIVDLLQARLQFALWSIFGYELGCVCHFVAHAFLDKVVVDSVHGIFVHLVI